MLLKRDRDAETNHLCRSLVCNPWGTLSTSTEEDISGACFLIAQITFIDTSSQSDTSQSDTSQTDTSQSYTSQSDTSQSDTSQSDTSQSDTSQSDTCQSNILASSYCDH